MTLTDQFMIKFNLKIIHLLSFCFKQKKQNGAVHEHQNNLRVLCVIISIKDESNFEALKLEDVLPNAEGFQHVLVDEALLDIENGDCV